jgi:hypothetical protein
MHISPTLLEQYSWEKLPNVPEGTVLCSDVYQGVLFGIQRGPMALCAYLVLPVSVNGEEISCHGGTTYGVSKPGVGYQVVGWDYAHHLDQFLPSKDLPAHLLPPKNGYPWDLASVLSDVQSTIDQLELTTEQKERAVVLATMTFKEAQAQKKFKHFRLKTTPIEF